MQSPNKPYKTYNLKEYIQLLEESDYKIEYLNGHLKMMAGGTNAHARISGNIFGELYQLHKGNNCTPFNSDCMIAIESEKSFVFPDVSVVCGHPDFSSTMPEAIINPTLIIEVLSESTELYDRTEKFQRYWNIPSLKEYVLVSQKEFNIQVYYRENKNSLWHIDAFFKADDSVFLRSINTHLSITDIYNGLEI